MPNEDKRQKELTQEELDAQKFRTFFSTSVAQVPEAMSRSEDAAEKAPRKGLFGGLFRRREDPAETPAEPEAEKPDALPPTGEIRLDGSVEEPDAGLELARHADEELLPFEDEELDIPLAPEKPAEPTKSAKPAAPAKPTAPKPAPAPEKKPEDRAAGPAAPRPRTAMEQKEDEEMKERRC